MSKFTPHQQVDFVPKEKKEPEYRKGKFQPHQQILSKDEKVVVKNKTVDKPLEVPAVVETALETEAPVVEEVAVVEKPTVKKNLK